MLNEIPGHFAERHFADRTFLSNGLLADGPKNDSVSVMKKTHLLTTNLILFLAYCLRQWLTPLTKTKHAGTLVLNTPTRQFILQNISTHRWHPNIASNNWQMSHMGIVGCVQWLIVHSNSASNQQWELRSCCRFYEMSHRLKEHLLIL